MPARVPRLRSALFVPAHRRDFLDSAAGSGADGVVLDLEDAVPADRRDDARTLVARWLDGARDQTTCVRINGLATGSLDADLDVAVRPGLTAVMAAKTETADDIRRIVDGIARREQREGLPEGTVRVWPLVESAVAVRNAYEMASASGRVAYMGSAAAPGGDLARSLGFRWSGEFFETLYVRSKVLVDVRAAGVPNPMTGVVTAVRDNAEIEAFARHSRAIGYEGMMVIHPAHVPVVNAVFTDSGEDVAAAQRLLDAMEAASREGAGAIEHEGRMVDTAMTVTAREVVARAEDDEAP